jgi:PAS domain S-box-containing protein
VTENQFVEKLAAPILAAAELAQLGVSVSVVEAHGVRRIYVSDAAARILGYSVEELIGSSTFLTFAPEELDRVHDMSQRWRRGERIPHFLETVALRKDGTRIPLEVAYSVVDLDGQPATIAFLRDISERKRTEEALKKSEGVFRKLVEAAPEAVLVAKELRIAYVNPRLLRLLGYERAGDLLDRDTAEFVHPDDRVLLGERQKLVRSSPEPAPPVEYRLIKRDGSNVAVECSSLPIEFEGAPAILTFLRDVTERKQIQAQLIQTDRMATVGTLAAGVAHELNNPLAYVLLNLGILERELDALIEDAHDREGARARLATIQEGAERMASIVRDLRSFCRPNAPSLVPVNMRQVLESSINMAMNELRERARVIRDYAPVPPVIADGARLGQVFLNLLLNAAQAVAEGSPNENEVRVVLRAEAGDRVRVEIADSGHGIAPEIMGRIFEPFFTTKPIGVGTGLGLSICQSIVSSMQGDLTVESEVGRGTTFRVVLPLPAATAELHEDEPAVDPGNDGARILVVDDESALAVALKKVLGDDHEVTTVTTGDQALRLLSDGARFDVIVCDVLMPGTSGIDVYRRIEKTRPELAKKFIFMTGASSMPRVADFFRHVPNRKIDKPVDVPRLRQLVREIARG